MNDLILRTVGLGKQYRVGRKRERYYTLRDLLADTVTHPVRAVRAWSRRNGAGGADEYIWALRDVSVGIRRGEAVGIIGRNGAGKSTFLKILSRITKPSAGYADLHGRVGSLLEVGTGFHPELTGRENIILNGAILGMRRAEIIRRFDEIVAFAEVDRFIDTPVKHYSSGMYLRLAFAVAAHLEPEVLLVDEVLAVGDAAFQKKCLGKMEDVASQDRTVLFVSHNMGAIRSLCRRAIWFDQGLKRDDGPADEVIEAYLASLAENTFQYHSDDHGLTIRSVLIKDHAGRNTLQFRPGDDVVVEVAYTALRPIANPYLILLVESLNGSCFSANMLLDGRQPGELDGEGVIACRFKSVPLLPQSYSLKMAIRASNGKDNIVKLQDVASFSVVGDLEESDFRGEFRAWASRSTAVMIPYEWVLPDGSIHHVSLTRARPE